MGPVLFLLAVVALALADSPQHYCGGNPSFVSNAQPHWTLQKVMLVTRHGDRTPVSGSPWPPTIENVVWNCTLNLDVADGNNSDTPRRVLRKRYIAGREVLPGNCLLGQLTSRGAQQHQALGQSFRKTYVSTLGFLPKSLDAKKVRVRSTDVERTLLSAYNFLEGLYPSDKGEVFSIETVDENTDNAYPNPALYPQLLSLWNTTTFTPGYQSFYTSNVAPLAAKYSALWGVQLSAADMRHVNDIVRARYCHGYALPPKMTLADAEQLMIATRVLDNLVAQPLPTLQLSSGTFLQDILHTTATKSELFHLFSAHDDTLRSLLLAVAASANSTTRWPPYASHLAFEMWTDSNQNNFIVAQYDGQNQQLKAPCQSLYCRLQDFTALVNSYLPPSNLL